MAIAALFGFLGAFIVCSQIWFAAGFPTAEDEWPYYIIAFLGLGIFFTIIQY